MVKQTNQQKNSCSLLGTETDIEFCRTVFHPKVLVIVHGTMSSSNSQEKIQSGGLVH